MLQMLMRIDIQDQEGFKESTDKLRKPYERLDQPLAHPSGKVPAMLLLSKARTESCGKALSEFPQAAGRDPEKLLLFRENT